MAKPDALIKIYREAYLLIIEQIALKAPKGNVTAFEHALLRDINGILTELDEEATDWVAKAIPENYRAGMNATAEALRDMGLRIEAQAQIVGVHRQAVEVLAENTLSDLLDANRLVGRRVQGTVRRLGLQAVTEKVSTGQTVRETKRLLIERLQAEGLKAAGGVRLDSYAELVARSTTREATNLGRINQQTELGYDLVTIPPHTPTCEICAQFQGRVYSVSGSDDRYPALYETAFRGGYNNIHPNCGHSAVPYVEELADDPASDREASNKAFEDTRGTRERNAYLKGRERRTAATRRRREKEQSLLQVAA